MSAITINATLSIDAINVPGTEQQVDSGIHLFANDKITRISGAGKVGHTQREQWSIAGDGKRESDDKFAFSNISAFALAAWVDARGSQSFEPAVYPTATVERKGTLYFAMNDHWDEAKNHKYENNSGNWCVSVEWNHTFEVAAETNDIEGAWGDNLLELQAGDSLEITASGWATYWDGGDRRGPEGKAWETAGADQRLLTPGITEHALVGKIGNGAPFEIGKSYQGTVSQAGGLYLSINDMIKKEGAFANNSGTFDITITVKRACSIE
jgi:hypothetical protein